MQTTPGPRQFLPIGANMALPGPGLPMERQARIAARRAFVGMKQCFIGAVASIDSSRGLWLRHQVRQSNDPVDLWLLRGAVFDALAGDDTGRLATRRELHRVLDSHFADSRSGFETSASFDSFSTSL